MRFYPRLRRKPNLKKMKYPALVDIDKLAKREDVEAIAKRLQTEERRKLFNRVASLSPRKRHKLLKMLEEQKGAKNEKKA